MSSEILLLVTPRGFTPVGDHDHDLHREFAVGSRVRATITKSKSKDMLAFYWALISYVSKGIGIQKDPLSQELLIRGGYVEAIQIKGGSDVIVPMSIAKMQHVTFRAYVDAAIELICRDYIANVRRGDLIGKIEKMVGIKYEKEAANDNDMQRRTA